MNVYITYDRYERNEWFNIYHIETDKRRAIKHCKKVDLIDFISYGPDDCHSFQLQKVEMTRKEYLRFCELVEKEGTGMERDEERELRELMIEIYENSSWNDDANVLISTDGCSDNWEIIQQYCLSNGLDYDEDYEIATDALENEETYRKELEKHIRLNY